MTGHHDDAVFLTGKLCNDVANWKFSFGSIRGERVLLDRVAFQMRDDVVLDLLVVGAADGTWTEGHDVFHILQGPVAIKRRRRTNVRGEGQRWERRVGGNARRRILPFGLGSLVVAIAGE